MGDGAGTGSSSKRRWAATAVALLAIAAVAACKPLPLGSAGAQIGNDVEACPQFQPSSAAPCGPQPLVWAAINGPYETFENGDPYATKCGRNLTASAAACSSGIYAGGATNELYDPTGYEYAIDVSEADVGRPIAVEVWDAGAYPRRIGTTTATTTVNATAGSATITRTAGTSFSSSDVGESITGTGIPLGARIVGYTNSNTVTISPAATTSGSRVITQVPDCLTSAYPFNASPYNGSVGTTNCQTGDSGSAKIQFQVFDDDGDDLKVTYDEPLEGCHLFVDGTTALLASMPTYKSAWAPICTFTPTAAGIYPIRVKSSAIVLPDGTPIADVGSGYNNFALRLGGGTSTRLYAIDALSIFANTPAASARFYLAEITSANAGKRLQIDLFDPGDGNSGTNTIQVLAPPSGAPAPAPTGGAVIPAPGLADSCRYNSTPSATRGPNVSAPAGIEASQCTVVARSEAVSPANRYNNNWLRIEVDIAEDYACATDCWWTIRYSSTSSSVPTDRTVWAVTLVDAPADPEPTTTTTSTTEAPTTSAPAPSGSPTDRGGWVPAG